MDIELTLNETRIIGALIEKEITTPDQYPLSLNALTNACNQKSNRDPVLRLDEQTVQSTIDELVKKRTISDHGGVGSRVVKYKHRFCNTEFSKLQLSDQELGILCVLFLRGPQTPGELRTRTNRLCKFADLAEVESALDSLTEREDGPMVQKLAREPGNRESRFAHLFSGPVRETEGANLQTSISVAASAQVVASQGASTQDSERIAALEKRVEQMQNELETIKQELGMS